MNHPVVNNPGALNGASSGAARRRSPHAGADFAAINAMAAARRTQGGDDPDANVAAADPVRLLDELNRTRPVPHPAVAAAINAPARGNETGDYERIQAEQHEELTRQARKLVSQTFFGPMLKQMRNSPFKSELFEGGRGGQVFNSMFDQHLADRMAGSASSKLVSAIVRRLEQHGQPAPRPASPYQNVRIDVAPGLGS